MDSKEDEDINIDFGKIKNFFKPKKEAQEPKEAQGHSLASQEKKDASDDELSIDFGKVKNLFKQSGHSSEEQDIKIDWGRITDFFRKYGIVLVALIPIILSIYIRMQAGYLPFTDSWASSTVTNNIQSQIRASIDQQYPNLPDANKNALVDAELQKIISQNKAQIDQQMKATSAYFKSFFQDESGKNYMPDIDPYYWVRYADNIVKNGHPGDILKDGKPFDNHQLAPLGRFVFPDMFHPYSLAYFYKFVHFFVPDLTLMRSAFYLPVIISALCVLLVFLIARKIAGTMGGFFAGLMMAVNSAFLGRTLFGHADNDIWVIFFPLLITWLFVASIDVKSILKIAVLTTLAGLFTGLYTRAWSGWWYIFDFLLAAIGITFAYLLLTNFAEIRKNPRFLFSNIGLRDTLIFGLGYFASAAFFVTLFSGWTTFRNSFLGPLSFPSIKAPVSASLWPNVLTTVAELNEGSLNGIINSVGGQFFFFIALAGLILTITRIGGLRRFDFFYMMGTILFYGLYFLLKKIGIEFSVYTFLIWILAPIFIRVAISAYRKDASYDFRLSLLLTLWIISTVFASIKGIRFTILLAPAFSVAFGVALGKTYFYFSKLLSAELKVPKAIGSSMLIVLLIGIFFISPTKAAINIAGSDMPIINDAWYSTLSSINKNSSSSAIITSWWDFGHHFKSIADRPVTFDGTTQTWPTSHWVGRFFMTYDEREAAGILRMIDCGSNNAFHELEKIKEDHHAAYAIVKEIIMLEKDAAKKRLLEHKLTNEQADKILELTHCNAPEAYIIASDDMIGKSGVWSHFGSWNFERADIWLNARRMPQEKAVDYMMKKFNYSRETAENTYYEVQSITSDSEANSWIAPWPGYGGTASCSRNSQGIFVCGNGFFVNLSGNDVYAVGQQGIVRPKIAAFATESGLLRKEFNGTVADFGMTIVPKSENEMEVVLSSKELAGSMFTRMYYMQGHGLKYFKAVNHQRGLTGTNIYTYKVDWEGKAGNIVEDYVKYLKPPIQENSASGPGQNNTNIS